MSNSHGPPARSPTRLPVYTIERGSDGHVYVVHRYGRFGKRWIRYTPSTRWINLNLPSTRS